MFVAIHRGASRSLAFPQASGVQFILPPETLTASLCLLLDMLPYSLKGISRQKVSTKCRGQSVQQRAALTAMVRLGSLLRIDAHQVRQFFFDFLGIQNGIGNDLV